LVRCHELREIIRVEPIYLQGGDACHGRHH
jgi:hypothetical protein